MGGADEIFYRMPPPLKAAKTKDNCLYLLIIPNAD